MTRKKTQQTPTNKISAPTSQLDIVVNDLIQQRKQQQNALLKIMAAMTKQESDQSSKGSIDGVKTNNTKK
jgi:hypothetical protein